MTPRASLGPAERARSEDRETKKQTFRSEASFGSSIRQNMEIVKLDAAKSGRLPREQYATEEHITRA